MRCGARKAPARIRRAHRPIEPQDNAPVGERLQIPGYRMLRMIGEGGMAQVYLVERERDGIRWC
jgi:hypothetical protein